MSFPVQHLADEALAAFADGVLSGAPRARAQRHVADCSFCRDAVEVQREAVSALRATPAPALPSALLDRLRALPGEAPLPTRPTALGADGLAVFPAYGTPLTTPVPVEPAHRRIHHVGLLSAAAAVVTFGTLAAGAGGVAGAISSVTTPGSGSSAPTRVAPGRVTPRIAPARADTAIEVSLLSRTPGR